MVQVGALTDHLVPDPEQPAPEDDPLGREEDELPQYANLTARTPSQLLTPGSVSTRGGTTMHLHQAVLSEADAPDADASLSAVGFLAPRPLPGLLPVSVAVPDRGNAQVELRHTGSVRLQAAEMQLVRQAHAAILLCAAHPRTAATRVPVPHADGQAAGVSGRPAEARASELCADPGQAEADGSFTGLWVVPVKPREASAKRSKRDVGYQGLVIDWAVAQEAAGGARDLAWQDAEAGKPLMNSLLSQLFRASVCAH